MDSEEKLMIMFQELNADIRATANKVIEFAVGYCAAGSVAVWVALEKTNSLLSGGGTMIALLCGMLAFGLAILALQRIYRGRRISYTRVIVRILDEVDIAREARPKWMRETRLSKHLAWNQWLWILWNLCWFLVLEANISHESHAVYWLVGAAIVYVAFNLAVLRITSRQNVED